MSCCILSAGTSKFSIPCNTFSVGPPLAPINLHAQLIGNVSIILSWQKDHQSSVPIKSYKIFWWMTSTKGKKINGTEKSTVTAHAEFTFPCLMENSRFTFQVKAVNIYGASKESQPISKNTKDNFNPHCEKKKKVEIHTKSKKGWGWRGS